MPKSSALAMWCPWLAVALLSLAVAADVEPSSPSPALDAPQPRQPKLLERDRASPRVAQRTLDRGASELAWRNWLQSPESKDPAAPPRRITPKSVFITPHNCPDGKRLNGEGCISVQQVGKEVHEQYILEQLNHMTDAGGVVYDYEDTPSGPGDNAEGPLQLNLPLGLSLTAAPSQNVPSKLPINADNKDVNKAAELEAELEKLKRELDKLSTDKNEKPMTHIVLNDYPNVIGDKPKRDNDRVNDTAVKSDDQGQKEVVFGNVSEDKYMTINQTQDDKTSIKIPSHNSKVSNNQETRLDIITTTDAQLEVTTELTTTDSTEADTEKPAASTTITIVHNLKENEKPTKLHPEIDYSDIGEAVKLISRYAEVSTDDTFNKEQKKAPEDGPLGTRTKQQHRRKSRPTASESILMDAFPALYPPPPPPHSVYDDRIPARIVYPKSPTMAANQIYDYYHYAGQQQRYPLPPADYPFRHVQEYWARPELFLGPYAHNPTRHHHSYSQPPHRARRPSPAPAAADLYRLLGLRHWFSGDGAAER